MEQIMKVAIYIGMCVLQPICLPVPEVATITYGAKSIGSFGAVMLGLPSTLLGITILYMVAKNIKIKRSPFHKKNEKLAKYKAYINKNPMLITGLLFIIPVIPDEIICIGAARNGLKFSGFIVMATIFKGIGFVVVGYSETIGKVMGVNHIAILLIEVAITLLLAKLFTEHGKDLNIQSHNEVQC